MVDVTEDHRGFNQLQVLVLAVRPGPSLKPYRNNHLTCPQEADPQFLAIQRTLVMIQPL